MQVTLIIPGVGKKANEKYISSWKMEPLVLGVLAGLTPPDVEITAIDDRIEPIPYDLSTDLVAITVEAYTARRAYHIASEFRKRGVPVVLGGYHATLMPDEAIQFADTVVIGEAEGVWRQVIEDIKNHRVKKFYKSPTRPSLTGIKPRRDIFKSKKYMPITLVESARGCKFSCNFCSITAFYNRSYNWRPPNDIIEEIKRLGRKNIFFVDDNITTNIKRAKKLFSTLIPLKIRWVSQTDITIADDEELLKLMKKSGCAGFLIGFESLNKRNLTQMGKGWNIRMGGYDMRIKRLQENGFKIYATFVFGYDFDDKDTFKRTVEFALKNKFFLTAFNHLMPFPGTPLYNRLAKDKRLIYDKWWLDPNYKFGEAVFIPKQLSPDELTYGCVEARRQFYKYSSIISRFGQNNCNDLLFTGLFIWLNLLLQREVKKKQRLPLGEGLDK